MKVETDMRLGRWTCRSCRSALENLNSSVCLQKSNQRVYSSRGPEDPSSEIFSRQTTGINQFARELDRSANLSDDAESRLSSAKSHGSTTVGNFDVHNYKQDLFTFPYLTTNHSNEEHSIKYFSPDKLSIRPHTIPLQYQPSIPLQPKRSSTGSQSITASVSSVKLAANAISSDTCESNVRNSQSIRHESHPTRLVEELDLKHLDNHSKLSVILESEPLPDNETVDQIFKLYYSLPTPRVCYLSRQEVRKILKILSRQNNLLKKVGARYMVVIKDMLANETAIRQSEWQCLIDAIGKGFHFEDTVRMDLVTKICHDMEQSGQLASIATLTSLLQTAVRNNSLPMYNYINEEIRARTSDDNLIVWTTRMKWAGKQRNVDLINKTFAEFWEKGITVDIVFINSFLEALLRSNESRIAELVYLRFRSFVLHRLNGSPFSTQLDQTTNPIKRKVSARKDREAFIEGGVTHKIIEREIAERRIDIAELFNEDGSPTPTYNLLAQAMERTDIKALVPRESTTRLFISYHCHETGRMADVAFYLNEMKIFNIEPLYSTYVTLLHGFFLWHKPDGEWDATRLENVFSFIRRGVVDGNLPFPITYALVLTAIRAFGKVYGGKRAREAWELLRPCMKVNENVKDFAKLKENQLEQVVVRYESGKELSWDMSGGNPAWRVLPDYRRD